MSQLAKFRMLGHFANLKRSCDMLTCFSDLICVGENLQHHSWLETFVIPLSVSLIKSSCDMQYADAVYIVYKVGHLVKKKKKKRKEKKKKKQ